MIRPRAGDIVPNIKDDIVPNIKAFDTVLRGHSIHTVNLKAKSKSLTEFFLKNSTIKVIFGLPKYDQTFSVLTQLRLRIPDSTATFYNEQII